MNDDSLFLENLSRLGFFGYSTPETRQAIRDEIEKRGWSGIFGNAERLYPADAEDLAEGGVCSFLTSVSAFLAREGISRPTATDDISDDGYTVLVNDTNYDIYNAIELERDENEQPGLIWGLSMTRCFNMINQLLESVGSAERLYAVNGGNDLFGFFLTPHLFELIVRHPQARPSDGPYECTENYPRFGQPA